MDQFFQDSESPPLPQASVYSGQWSLLEMYDAFDANRSFEAWEGEDYKGIRRKKNE